MSDFNLQTLNTKEFAEHLTATIQFGGNLFAIAQRGTGKTSITRDIISKSACKEVYFNLSLMERPDLGGYPDFFNGRKDKFIRYILPQILKPLIDGDQPCVVILDEIDKAEGGLLGPLLEFLQEKSINGMPLKNLQAVIMTGNLIAEGGAKLPAPLLDRTEKYLIQINPQHWLDWGAATGKIHPTVSAYIADNMEDLCGETDMGEKLGNQSPRSWDNASRYIWFGEKHNWNSNLILQKVAGCIGKQVSMKYHAFFEHYQILLPMVDKILNGQTIDFNSLEETKKLIINMLLCGRFAKILDKTKENSENIKQFKLNNIDEQISKRVANFMSDNVDPEMSFLCLRSQIGHQRVLDFDLMEDPNWDSLLTSIVNELE